MRAKAVGIRLGAVQLLALHEARRGWERPMTELLPANPGLELRNLRAPCRCLGELPRAHTSAKVWQEGNDKARPGTRWTLRNVNRDSTIKPLCGSWLWLRLSGTSQRVCSDDVSGSLRADWIAAVKGHQELPVAGIAQWRS